MPTFAAIGEEAIPSLAEAKAIEWSWQRDIGEIAASSTGDPPRFIAIESA